jgi:hypothetical protein
MVLLYGSFTLAKFVSETVSDSDIKQYLPWPPWATRQEIETILSVSRLPRWPRQVNCDCRCCQRYCVTFTNVNMALFVFVSTPSMETMKYIVYKPNYQDYPVATIINKCLLHSGVSIVVEHLITDQ